MRLNLLRALLFLRFDCCANFSREGGGGGVLDVSLVGEVRRGPSYPNPV